MNFHESVSVHSDGRVNKNLKPYKAKLSLRKTKIPKLGYFGLSKSQFYDLLAGKTVYLGKISAALKPHLICLDKEN